MTPVGALGGLQLTTPVSGGDPKEKLKSLQEMLEDGLITQSDFDSKKADILSAM